MIKKPGKMKRKVWITFISGALIAFNVLPFFFYREIPAPPGAYSRSGPLECAREDIRLLIDSTSFDPASESRIISQTIFDEILSMIDRADLFVYADLFLWNPWQGKIPEKHRALSTELAEALIRKKEDNPDLPILVLTDPINRIYGGHQPAFFHDMVKAGVKVVFTPLPEIPDSNRFYSPWSRFYGRLFSQWSIFDSLADRPLIPNPFVVGGPRISLRQFGRLLYFKANHRKVFITGSKSEGLELLVGSLNPADGSSAHSNIALRVRGPAALEAIKSELSLTEWSAAQEDTVLGMGPGDVLDCSSRIRNAASNHEFQIPGEKQAAFVEWLSEMAIRENLIEALGASGSGDEIRIALFYLSDSGVVEAIKKAARQKASVRLILDANRDAFGMKKIGIPNRPLAADLEELGRKSDIQVRWADTHGEQFHAKVLSIRNVHTGKDLMLLGSANWTRRNLQNLNLEANLFLTGAPAVTKSFIDYFDRAWENKGGVSCTLPYEAWEEKGVTGVIKKWAGLFQEWSGMSSF